MPDKRWLITGGLGFIGSHFTDLVCSTGDPFLVIDNLTYSANPDLHTDDRVIGDICDRRFVLEVLSKFRPDVLVNFAAETHVDNSYRQVPAFTRSNVDGVANLLEAVRGEPVVFVQISTDEVYGDEDIVHTTNHPMDPQNPYAATKAAAEFMVHSYQRSFGVETLVTRSSNNWGPRQHPEKFIPAALRAKRTGIPMVVHDYSYKRDWIHVEDNVRAIYELIELEARGTWNIGTGIQHSLAQILDRIGGVPHIVSPERLGADVGYCIDPSPTWNRLGWQPPDLFADPRWEQYLGDRTSKRLEAVW